MTPDVVLDVVHNRSRLITDDDLAALFGVSARTIRERVRRGEFPRPLTTHPYSWSAQQIDRFLAADEVAS
jgi:predicted DNA-binding transcriptional regulator AlpA